MFICKNLEYSEYRGNMAVKGKSYKIKRMSRDPEGIGLLST